MMAGSMERARLHVEGTDDQHSIVHLLGRHGVDYDPKPWPPEFPKVEQSKSVEKLLKGMVKNIQLSEDRLAWQEEPGSPYGTAIRARYFQHAGPAALAFVAWFKRLYKIA